jgi:enolase
MLTEPHTFLSTIIKNITARKIFNIRGEETIEVDVTTAKGCGRASAPAGASRGKGEAVPYPKGDVSEAVKKVTEVIAPKLKGIDAQKQEIVTENNQIDKLDETTKFNCCSTLWLTAHLQVDPS